MLFSCNCATLLSDGKTETFLREKQVGLSFGQAAVAVIVLYGVLFVPGSSEPLFWLIALCAFFEWALIGEIRYHIEHPEVDKELSRLDDELRRQEGRD